MARQSSNVIYLASPEKGVDGRGLLAKARAPLMTDGRIGDFWVDTVSRKLYGPKNAAAWPDNGLIKGDKGWMPALAAEIDGVRRIMKVVDWIGGEGAKPTTTGYIGATGIVPNKADAVDYRGAQGPQALINALAAKTDAVTYDTLTALAEGASDNEKAALKFIFEVGGAMPVRSRTEAAALSIPANMKAVSTLFYAPSYGTPATLAGAARYRRVNTEPAHELKFRSVDRFTAEGATDTTNGGWWEIYEETVTPQMAGAKGDKVSDDIIALRRWVAYHVSKQSWSALPGDTKRRTAPNARLNGGGLVYAISDKLDISGCNGAVLSNISFVAIASANWGVSVPIVYADLTDFLRVESSVHFNSNFLCAGPDFQRCWALEFKGRCFGAGKSTWGLRLGPAGWSVSSKISGAHVLGCISSDLYNVSSTEILSPSSRIGDGVLIDAVDVEIGGGCYIGLFKRPVNLKGGGVHFVGNHVYNGWPGAEADASIPIDEMGVYVDNVNGGCIISNNQFDHCCIYIRGTASRKKIVDNIFFGVPTTPVRYMVVLEATAVGQSIENFTCRNNSGHGPFSHGVFLKNVGGNYYYRTRFTIIEGTVIEYYDSTPVNQAYPECLGVTRGMARFSFDAVTDFDASGHIALDLSRYMLPVTNNDTDFMAAVSLQTFDGTYTNTSYPEWTRTDIANKKLHVKFGKGAFNNMPGAGRICVEFDMGQSGPLMAN